MIALSHANGRTRKLLRDREREAILYQIIKPRVNNYELNYSIATDNYDANLLYQPPLGG